MTIYSPFPPSEFPILLSKKTVFQMSFLSALLQLSLSLPVFRCAVASLYEVVSVRSSVGPSVRRSVGPSRVIFEGEKHAY